MSVYMVDRNLPNMTVEELLAVQKVAIEICREFTAQGSPVRYLRSTFVPGESSLRCLFEAPNAAVVEEVNKEADIPFHRVVEALDLSP